MRIRKLENRALTDIYSHLELTADTHIKCYTKRQLAFLDGIDAARIWSCGKYLPVRIDTAQNTWRHHASIWKRPYRELRIRLDEIKHIYSKRNQNTVLVVDHRRN